MFIISVPSLLHRRLQFEATFSSEFHIEYLNHICTNISKMYHSDITCITHVHFLFKFRHFFQYTKTVSFSLLNTINKTFYMDFCPLVENSSSRIEQYLAHLDLLNKLALFLWCSSTMQALFSIVPVVIQLIFFMRWRALTHELSSTYVQMIY